MTELTPLERFESMLKLEQKSQGTIDSYMKGVRKFERYLDEQGLTFETFDAKTILPYMSKLNEVEKVKPATMRLYIISLKRYFAFLKEQGIKDISIPKMKYPTVFRGKPKYIDKPEFQRLYAATYGDLQFRAMFSTTYATAMRVSEVCDSRVKDYDLGDNPSVYVSGKTSEETNARLPLTGTAVADIRTYLKDVKVRTGYAPGPNDYMFFRQDDVKKNVTPRMANERLYALCSDLGMKKGVSWHWIRHSRATHLREDDVRLEDIGSLLRHRSSATTLIYADTDYKKLDKKVNKNDILGAKKE